MQRSAFKKAAAALQGDAKDADEGFVVTESCFREVPACRVQASVGRGPGERGAVSSPARAIAVYGDAALVAHSQE